MTGKIKVAAVSYLNTKPLLYGIENSSIKEETELSVDYPSMLATQLQQGLIDIALLPVAAIPEIKEARIVSDYGIAADGKVASVCIFSNVPIDKIKSLYLDYQSRTSVKLAELLFRDFWQQEIVYKTAPEHYIDYIRGDVAGVIIGDRALKQLHNFEYVYDLAEAWKQWTGLPFIFAAWVAVKNIDKDFLHRFDEANAIGLNYLDEIITSNPFPYYELKKYYTENILYYLDEEKKKGLELFLEKIK